MTELELAERVGISRNQLYQIKRGSRTKPETLGRFADVFGLTRRTELDEFYRLAGFIVPQDRLAAAVPPSTSHYLPDDISPELESIYGFQGKVFRELPPGPVRDQFIATLRAFAESYLNLLEQRLEQED